MSLGVKVVVLVMGVILSLIWLYLMKSSNGVYEEQISEIDSEEYFLPTLFQIGFCVIEKLKIDFSGEFFQKRKDKISEIKGDEAAEFYLYVNIAGQLSYVLTILPLGLMFSLVADSAEMILITLIFTGVLAYYFDYSTLEAVDERHDVLLRDLPGVLSKLSLLINAGLILREAWARVAETGERALYQEMQDAVYSMENGLSDREALEKFSRHCNVKEIKKFISVVEQNIEKGSTELAKSLRELSKESWNEKKQLTIQKGAAADAKLLIPTGIIFMGILIVIIVPLFNNMF